MPRSGDTVPDPACVPLQCYSEPGVPGADRQGSHTGLDRTALGYTMSGRRYLTLKEFSAHTGLSVATIRRLFKRGQLPAFQPGGPRTKLLFQADALEHTGEDIASPQSVIDSTPSIPGPTPRWRGRARQERN